MDPFLQHFVDVMIEHTSRAGGSAHESRARIGNLVLIERGIGNRFLHRGIGVNRVRRHAAQNCPRNGQVVGKLPGFALFGRKLKAFNGAGKLVGNLRSVELRMNFNSAALCSETLGNFGATIADAGNETESCDYNAAR